MKHDRDTTRVWRLLYDSDTVVRRWLQHGRLCALYTAEDRVWKTFSRADGDDINLAVGLNLPLPGSAEGLL